mmetsp:Transcript_19369/g.65836  ORF Transcript_19369/g.65836 Transcript_19369/m.65836 type:complete len:86 (-) Transcript_19369:1387-1644(-)
MRTLGGQSRCLTSLRELSQHFTPGATYLSFEGIHRLRPVVLASHPVENGQWLVDQKIHETSSYMFLLYMNIICLLESFPLLQKVK